MLPTELDGRNRRRHDDQPLTEADISEIFSNYVWKMSGDASVRPPKPAEAGAHQPQIIVQTMGHQDNEFASDDQD
jgi:hypothetical protein